MYILGKDIYEYTHRQSVMTKALCICILECENRSTFLWKHMEKQKGATNCQNTSNSIEKHSDTPCFSVTINLDIYIQIYNDGQSLTTNL